MLSLTATDTGTCTYTHITEINGGIWDMTCTFYFAWLLFFPSKLQPATSSPQPSLASGHPFSLLIHKPILGDRKMTQRASEWGCITVHQ